MKRTALRFPAGFLAAGIFGASTFVWACEEQPTATGSCSSSGATLAAAATPTPAVPAAATPAPARTTPVASPAGPGMRIHMDPETGVIGGPGPLPPLIEEEAKLLQPGSEEELPTSVLPDGSLMVDLQGRGQEYFIMQIDANGQRVVRCVQDPNTVAQPAPRSKPEER